MKKERHNLREKSNELDPATRTCLPGQIRTAPNFDIFANYDILPCLAFWQIWHVSGFPRTFWHKSKMILHGFASRHSKTQWRFKQTHFCIQYYPIWTLTQNKSKKYKWFQFFFHLRYETSFPHMTLHKLDPHCFPMSCIGVQNSTNFNKPKMW